MVISEKLKNLRLKTKNTLKEQSEVFGVSINTVYRWEHGLAAPRKSILKEMADYYNVPYEWLAQDSEGEDDGMFPENDVEQQLLTMFRKLPDISKYKILGYTERMLVESMDVSKQ